SIRKNKTATWGCGNVLWRIQLRGAHCTIDEPRAALCAGDRHRPDASIEDPDHVQSGVANSEAIVTQVSHTAEALAAGAPGINRNGLAHAPDVTVRLCHINVGVGVHFHRHRAVVS